MILFISDLHLSAQTPELTRIFLTFLGGRCRAAEALYILGDFFDYWVGDDEIDDPYNRHIVTALRELTDSGVALKVMHGNRDFLLGERFAAASGASLVPDPTVLSLPTWQFVLSHGDALCTGDSEYLAFRSQVRDPDWQRQFLARPLAERRAIAQGLRQRSEDTKREKTPELMDVAPGATEDFLRQHGYATCIHGHTHRPATHDHIVDGIHVERWVLADWREDGAASRGECLAWDGEKLLRQALA